MGEGVRRQDGNEVISVDVAGRTVLVARSQVWWVEAAGDYVRLHTAEGSYLHRESLDHLATRWAEHGFVRIHRFYLVYLPLVTELRKVPSGHSVHLGSGSSAVDLAVSRRQLKEFRQRWLQEHR